MNMMREFTLAYENRDRARLEELALLCDPCTNPRKTQMTEDYGDRSMKTVPMGHNAMQELGELKALYAALLTKLDGLRASTSDTDVKRMAAVAITEAETSSMWASKALSRRG